MKFFLPEQAFTLLFSLNPNELGSKALIRMKSLNYMILVNIM